MKLVKQPINFKVKINEIIHIRIQISQIKTIIGKSLKTKPIILI